jgi:hypothetical protein
MNKEFRQDLVCQGMKIIFVSRHQITNVGARLFILLIYVETNKQTPRTLSIGGWVSSRAGLNLLEKCKSLVGSGNQATVPCSFRP